MKKEEKFNLLDRIIFRWLEISNNLWDTLTGITLYCLLVVGFNGGIILLTNAFLGRKYIVPVFIIYFIWYLVVGERARNKAVECGGRGWLL